MSFRQLPVQLVVTYPCVRIFDRLKGTILPKKRPILLEKTFKGAATRTTIQPYGNVMLSIGIYGREKPKVKLAVLRWFRGDG